MSLTETTTITSIEPRRSLTELLRELGRRGCRLRAGRDEAVSKFRTLDVMTADQGVADLWKDIERNFGALHELAEQHGHGGTKA